MGDPSGPNQGRKVTKPAGRESGILDRLKQPEIIGTVEDKELECYHFWKFLEIDTRVPGVAKPPQGRTRRLLVRTLREGDKETVKAA